MTIYIKYTYIKEGIIFNDYNEICENIKLS